MRITYSCSGLLTLLPCINNQYALSRDDKTRDYLLSYLLSLISILFYSRFHMQDYGILLFLQIWTAQ